MASRVTVTINVRDNSRAGIRAARNQIRRLNDDIRRAGGTARFNVNVNGARARREMQRLQRQLGGRTIRINTRVDPPNRGRFRRSMMTLLAPARGIGGLIGGTMSDGIGQGIANGVRAGGPVFAAALVAIILGALSVVGAALSGLLVTALGAAFVGIGVASAFQAEEVKKNWKSTTESMKKDFKTVGDPLIEVVQHGIDRLGRMSEMFAPILKKALGETANSTDQFIQKILDGFQSFGKVAFQPIMDAWKVFAPVFGEEWDQFMHSLGEAFADMAKLVKEHPTEIAAALNVVFDVLVLLVKTVTFFGKVWASGMQAALDAVAFLMEGWASFVTLAVSNMGTILEAATRAFGWIPGLGGKLKDANRNFSQWKEETIAKMDGIKAKAEEMRGTLDRANKKRRLEADVSNWQTQMAKARASLKGTMSANARKQITANISDLQAKVRQAKVELAMLHDRVVNVTVRNLYDSSLNRHAKGGVVGQAASGGVRSNMTLVGEAGPEIVDLAPGSHVRSNPDTRRMLRGMGGTADPILVQFIMDGTVMAEAMVDANRRVVKRHGGVRATFGTL